MIVQITEVHGPAEVSVHIKVVASNISTTCREPQIMTCGMPEDFF